MIELTTDAHGRHVVQDQGRSVFALKVDEDGWEIYDRGRLDMPAFFALDLRPLFQPPEESASRRVELLEYLNQRWETDGNFRRLLDYVAPIIHHFYAERASRGRTEEHWILAAQGAKLCRLFLDFLDPQRNADRAERYYATRLLLQRTYYHLLAILHEMEPEVVPSSEDPRVPLYLDGWSLPREHRAALTRWHHIILEPKNGWLFRDLLDQSREAEMWSLLMDGRSPSRLRRFFCEPPGRDFVDYLIDRWFLPRYDLRSVEALRRALNELGRADDGRVVEKSAVRTHLFSSFGLVLGVFFFLACLPFNLPAWVRQTGPLAVTVLSLLLLLAGAVMSILKGPTWLRFMLPNLFTAVVVGYFPLLLGEEPWKFAMRLSDADLSRRSFWLAGPLTFLGFTLVVGLFTFVYLLSRVHAVGPPPRAAWRRALGILLRGLSYSFLVGVVAVDVLSLRLFDLAASTEPPDPELELVGPLMLVDQVDGMTGPIYPAVVWVFLWLALFVGVVVQVWWEEQAVTESW
jgi:hypothetical protein